MKKAIIMFIVFFVLDIALIALVEYTNALYLFVAAMFLEVAIFGSVIVWDIAMLKDKHEDDDENKQ